MVDIIGKWIETLRSRQRINRIDLGRGLCTEVDLRRIEERSQEPEKLLVDALMQRLGKSMNQYDLLLEDEEYDLLVRRQTIQKKLRVAGRQEAKLREAELEIEEYEQKRGTDTVLQKQFLSLQRAELLRRRRVSWQEQWNMVCYGLQQTFDTTFWEVQKQEPAHRLKLEKLKHQYLSTLEILLLTRYMILLELTGAEEEAENGYLLLLAYAEQKRCDIKECRIYYPLPAYHLAAYYARKGRFQQGLALLEKALEYLRGSKRQNRLFAKCFGLQLQLQRQQGLRQTAEIEREERYLQVFCEIFAEQQEIWEENDYPLYLELYAHQVSRMVRERRELLGLTQAQLAEGICGVITVSRLERGSQAPHQWTRNQLLGRLGVSFLKYDGGIVTEDYADFERLGEVGKLYYAGNYAGARQLFEELCDRMDMSYATNRYLEQYWMTRLRFAERELSDKERVELEWELLAQTLGSKEKQMQKTHTLTNIEREILRDVLWNNQVDDSVELYDFMKKHYDGMCDTEMEILFPELYITLLYCLGNEAFARGNTEEALGYVSEMLNKNSYMMSDWDLGTLYFLKGWILLKQGKEECRTVFQQNYIIYSLYLQDKVALRYMVSAVNEHCPDMFDKLLNDGC